MTGDIIVWALKFSKVLFFPLQRGFEYSLAGMLCSLIADMFKDMGLTTKQDCEPMTLSTLAYEF